jgi:nucleoside-diphosphate-sugar epimerase
METLARLTPRRILICGASGRLGSALKSVAERKGFLVTVIGSQSLRACLDSQNNSNILGLLDGNAEADIVFAGGLTDPNTPPADLMSANAELPSRFIELTAHHKGIRYLTVGSVLETFETLTKHNPYLQSKAELWQRMQKLSSIPEFSSRLCHLKLHTLYGGTPAPHSFLGQLYESLRIRQPFEMSDGRQIREYSHVEDVSKSMLALLRRKWPNSLSHDLSTSTPVALSDLAQTIFKRFNCEHLLRLGMLKTAPGENITTRFSRSPDWLLGRPRDQMNGIYNWLAVLLAAHGSERNTRSSGK